MNKSSNLQFQLWLNVFSATPLILLYCLHKIHCLQKKGPITKKYLEARNTRIKMERLTHLLLPPTGNAFPKLSGVQHTKPESRGVNVGSGLTYA